MIISSGDFIAQTIENENVRKNGNSRSRNNKINKIDDDNREDNNNNSSSSSSNNDDDNDKSTTEPSLILTPSEPQTEYLHSNLVLTCHVHAGDPVMARKRKRGMPHLYWHDSKGDVIEQHSARLRIERPDVYTVKLYISNISTEQAGLYKCALTWADLTEEKYLRVYVLDDITFIGADDPTKEVNAGENVQLNCKVQTNLLPTITWKFNGTIINKHVNPGRYTLKKDGSLLLKRVSKKDEGRYECKVTIESLGTFRTKMVQVRVLYPPEKIQISSLHKSVSGSMLHLTCQADGSSPLTFEWLKEQRITDILMAKRSILKNSSTYQVANMGESDEGRYFCRVSNSRGTSEAHIDVKLLSKPVIKKLTSQYKTLEGAPLILNCESTGSPTPVVKWLNGSLNKSLKYAVEGYGTAKLTIQRVEKRHEGEYICEASNEAGTVSTVVKLIVESMPSLKCEPPVHYGRTHQKRTFNCTAHGNPLPKIQWRRAGHEIVNNSKFTISTVRKEHGVESHLDIVTAGNEPWIYGNYTCLAKNAHGSQSSSVEFVRAKLPLQPHNFTVLDKNSTNIVIQLEINSNDPEIDFWKLDYHGVSNNESGSLLFNKTGNTRNLVMSGLSASTAYLVFLSAGNSIGLGEPIKFLVETNELFHNGTETESLLSTSMSSFEVKKNVTVITIICSLTVILICIIVYLKIRKLNIKDVLTCRKSKNADLFSSGIGKRCYSWYNATDTSNREHTSSKQIHLNNMAQVNNEATVSPDNRQCVKLSTTISSKLSTCSSKNGDSLDTTNIYCENDNSLHFLSETNSKSATCTDSNVLTNNKNHALDYNSLNSMYDFDDTSGIYEEIPKTLDSTAVSEILNEYHNDDNLENL